jgi:nicotinamide-nucleotide adenylyltransferase
VIGLYIGRFQPFHNGHLQAVEWILNECDQLIVLIGSSQSCYTPENPFTVGERVEMIYKTLKSHNLSAKCLILSVPDVNNNALWVAHINSLVPRYDTVYSNNPLTKRLFKDAGRKVSGIPSFERHRNDASRIRKSLLLNSDWKKLVPTEVAKFINETGAVVRVREVSRNDKGES